MLIYMLCIFMSENCVQPFVAWFTYSLVTSLTNFTTGKLNGELWKLFLHYLSCISQFGRIWHLYFCFDGLIQNIIMKTDFELEISHNHLNFSINGSEYIDLHIWNNSQIKFRTYIAKWRVLSQSTLIILGNNKDLVA